MKHRSSRRRSNRNQASRIVAAVGGLESLESRVFLTGTVQANVTLDANRNGVADPGEPGLAGWTVFVDYDNNGVQNGSEPSAVTNSSGVATITNVTAASQVIREIVPTGYAPAAGFKDFDHLTVKDSPRTNTVSFLNVTQASTGTIQGSVWNDIGGDGVRDPSDPGIPGWTVFIDNNLNRVLDAGEPSTTTDANGIFTFTNLAPAKYNLREITPAGWSPTLGADGKASATVTGGNTATASFGNFNAASLGSIKGTVWNDVNADGFRGAGDPGLGGWTVFLDTNGDGALNPGETSTTTDAAGVYSFPTVNVGNYVVAEVLQSGWNPSPGHPSSVNVTVANENPGVADFAVFTPTLGSISGTVWNDADGNGLIGPGEVGLPGRPVFIDQNNNGVADAGEISTVTDGAGNYTLPNLPIGSMVVRETPAVGATATAPGTGMQLVNVQNASVVTGVNFGNKVRADSSISGTVFVDSNGNGARDPGEKGIAGVTVFLDLNDNGIQDVAEPSTASLADQFFTPAINETGTYQFTHLPVGTYKVREVVPDLLSATPAAARALSVTVDPGGAVAGADFADVYRANEIHGVMFDDTNHNHVRDAGEAGIGGVTVYVDANRNNVADPGEPTNVTAADGSYAFTTNLGPGSYVVRALHFSGREDTYPTTTAGILWPAGVSNPAVGNVSPTSITTSLAENQVEHDTVSLTLPTAGGSLTNMVDVFLLFDDTGSFTANSPIVRAAFPQIIAALQAAMPTVDFGFGVGRFEEYANFAAEFPTGRPFILNQPIIDQSTPGFSLSIQSALDRTAPGYGGDQPETDIEALYQMATGAGFDGNNNGTTTDSGAAGLVNTQVNPGSSGDVPAFGSFTVDASGNVLPAAGNVGGAGFRAGALPIILVATDTGFAFQPMGETSITGVGGLTLPISDLTQTSRPSTPFASGAGIQQTVDALNALGALVIGLGTNGGTTADPRQDLEALAKLTGAVNRSATTIPNGTTTPIAPGSPLYFQIASGFSASVADGIVTAIENAATTVSVNLTLKASDPRVHIASTPGVINNVGAGQTATFDVTFTGDGRPHRFDLQFVRQGTNVVLGSIPVVIGTPIQGEGYEYVELEDGEIQHAEDFGDSYNPLLPVNVAPSFVKGADQSGSLNSGPQSVSGWATGITAGDDGQVVDFLVSNDNGSLFSVQPTVLADGTLSYTPAADASGSATVSIRLHDSGGTVGGGQDTGAVQTFTITIPSLMMLSLPGTSGNDAYEVRLEGGRLKVFAGGTLINDVLQSSVGGVTFGASAGSDTLTLTGQAGVADDIVIGASTATFGGVPISFTGAGSILFDGRGGDDNLTVSGGPTVTFAGAQHLGALVINGGRVAIAAGGGQAVVARSLSVTGAGRMDIADGSLLIDYDAAAPFPAADVRTELFAGRNGGTWDGPGIVSSAAASSASGGIGYINPIDLGMTTFAGQPIDATAMLIKATLAGDANLDGRITGDDYALADHGMMMGLGFWTSGDFDYDGAVTAADVAILDKSAAPPVTPAPEVTTATSSPEVVATVVSTPTVEAPAVTATVGTLPVAPAPVQSVTPTAKKPAPVPVATPKPQPKKGAHPAAKPAPHKARSVHKVVATASASKLAIPLKYVVFGKNRIR